MKIEFNSKWV